MNDEITTALPTGALPIDPSEPLEVPRRDGTMPSTRYVVIEEVGRGGMGVVRRAYDPKLQREVALKVLRDDMLDEQARVRMVREARAMAKLSHPNVVAVYDVEDDDGVTLVMEYVPGQTLRQWLRAEPRTPATIVDVFVQAGRGLAAAHAQGILHRDFKPANVLVGRDGRPRVTDFGLARLDDAGPSSAELQMTRQSSDSLSGGLTEAGQVLGTPRYMAPEQLEGQALTASVDQYAWCTAVWEALVGHPPFESRALRGLAAIKKQGPPPWPKDVVVSPRIVAALVRGLAPKPEERFASMEALLAAVTEVPAPRRGWQRAAVGVVVVSSVGGMWLMGRTPEAQCTGAREQLAVAWSDEHRVAAEAAVLGTGLVYAADTWAHVEPRLDAYAEAWVGQHTEACEATTVRGEQSAAAMDLRMGCLQRARMELRAAVELLERADADVVQRAQELVEGLPSLRRCDDVEGLRENRRVPDDPQVADGVETLRERLAQVRALYRVGSYAEGVSEAERVHEEARALGYAPFLAEALLDRGKGYLWMARYAAAAQDFEQAFSFAAEHQLHELTARAAIDLAMSLGRGETRLVEAHEWGTVGLALAKGQRSSPLLEASAYGAMASVLKEQGQLDEALDHHERALAIHEQEAGPMDVALSLSRIGLTLHEQGKYERALQFHQRALALRERELGPKHPAVAQSLGNIGLVLLEQGKLDEALRHAQRSRDLQIEALGPRHPDVAISTNAIGNILIEQGKLEQALDEHRRALAIREAAHGPRHPSVARSLLNIGNVLLMQNEPSEALEHYRRSLALQEELLGPRHPDIARALSNVGMVLERQGAPEEALQHQERAVSIHEEHLGPEHPEVAFARLAMAEVLRDLGRFEAAREEYARVLRIRERALGPGHPHVAYPLMGLAEVALARGDHPAARELAERALSLREAGETSPTLVANARFLLAKALWEEPAERDRALELAKRARDAHLEHGERGGDGLAEIEAWLAERKGR